MTDKHIWELLKKYFKPITQNIKKEKDTSKEKDENTNR
jgi:hypothetical protein